LNRELALRRGEIARRDRGIALRAGAGAGFVQVNSEQNENLRGLVRDWLSEVQSERVLELHAGSGNFTFSIAEAVGEVIATEIDGRAVDAGRAEQERRGVCNVHFKRASAVQAVERYAAGCDAVLCDPPRKGCPEAIQAIADVGPASVLYISCDPATLARDVRALAAAGYDLARVLPVDMFPQTFHIETLALLRRRTASI